ncbi:MAG: hypothetical protein JSU85_02035 [Candidatus Zixiibacteriota bacterium]|nr:MAG: hypothetical protein JSU85_02035 [candidate division Zixibacteria bacterium]
MVPSHNGDKRRHKNRISHGGFEPGKDGKRDYPASAKTSNGNVGKAARNLRIGRETLQNRIKKYSISKEIKLGRKTILVS